MWLENEGKMKRNQSNDTMNLIRGILNKQITGKKERQRDELTGRGAWLGRRCGVATSGHMVMLLIASSSLLATLASADHALSEVWSDSDGLQMKYSTNHDDLLSTKGSELSLSSTNKQHAAAAPSDHEQASEQGAEQQQQQQSQQQDESSSEQPEAGASAAGSTEGSESSGSPLSSSSDSSDESSGNDSSENSGEQGVDSSRQIPQRSQVKPQPQLQKFSDPPPKYRSPVPATKFGGRSSATAAAASTEDEAPMSFESAQADVGADEDQSSADPGAESASSQQSSENGVGGRFRRPGRLFKEALHMPSNDVSGSKTDSDEGFDSNDEFSQSAGNKQRANNEQANEAPSNENNSESGSDESSDNNSDNENNNNNDQSDRSASSDQDSENELQVAAAAGKSPMATHASGRSRQQGLMIDFDQLAGGTKQRGATTTSGADAFADGFEEPPPPPQRFGNSSPQMGQRVFSNEPRRQAMSMQHHATAAATGGRLPVASSGQVKDQRNPPTSYRSLPYFRNQVAAEQEQEARRSKSPDSERDNFISPGHFPGSMAHLTQAASETQKKEEPPAAPQETSATTSPSSSAAAATASDQAGASSSPTQESSQQVAAASDTLLSTAVPTATPANSETQSGLEKDAAESGSEGTRSITSQQVTPEPQSQPESQQIMAPILFSTTTMAPMPATSMVATTTGTATNTTQASSTSVPPSLKRFKFRKYR